MALGISSLLGEDIPRLKAANHICPLPRFQGLPSLKDSQAPRFSILGCQKVCSWSQLSVSESLGEGDVEALAVGNVVARRGQNEPWCESPS